MASRVRAIGLGIGLSIGVVSLARPAAAETAKPAGKSAAPAKSSDAAAKGATPKSADKTSKSTDAGSSRKPGPPPDKATSAKVNAYIELMNAETNPLYAMRSDLFREIDPKVGPTCKESLVLQHPIGPTGGKYDLYRKSITAKPPLKPDAAALKMIDAVEALDNLGREPGPHSARQSKDPAEWCKRIKEVFPRYVALFDQYIVAHRELAAYVDAFTEDRDLREIDASLKKYGKHYHYQYARLALEGKVMMRTVRDELHKESPDLAVLREHFASYFAIADETLAMMKQEAKNSDAYPENFYFLLSNSMPSVKSATERLLSALSEKRADSGKRVDSAWDSLIHAYNEVVGYGNNMEWRANQK